MHVAFSGPASAPPVLFLHGGGVGGWMWGPVLDELGDAVRAVVPDLPGHDHSAAEPYRGHDATVESLIAVLDASGLHTGVTVVGFSLGAQLAALLTAREHARVTHAIIVSAQAHPLPGTRATLGLLRMLAPLARNERFARAQASELRIPDALLDDYLRTSATMSRESLLASVGDNLRFTVPAGWHGSPAHVSLLLGGTERRVMHRSLQALRAERHDADVLVFEGVGHSIPFDRPALVADLIRAG